LKLCPLRPCEKLSSPRCYDSRWKLLLAGAGPGLQIRRAVLSYRRWVRPPLASARKLRIGVWLDAKNRTIQECTRLSSPQLLPPNEIELGSCRIEFPLLRPLPNGRGSVKEPLADARGSVRRAPRRPARTSFTLRAPFPAGRKRSWRHRPCCRYPSNGPPADTGREDEFGPRRWTHSGRPCI
jgi:hypothetical protein